MGTSSSYKGPTGGNRLLPPWAQGNPDIPPNPDEPNDNTDGQDDNEVPVDGLDNLGSNQEPDLVHMPSWRSPKANMRRLARDRGNIGTVARSYVRAKGGSSMAARTSVSGRQYAARLGGFLSDIAQNGIQFAVQNLGLQRMVGMSAENVFVGIIQALCPPGTTLEDHIARRALTEALSNLFERYGALDNVETLDSMDEQAIHDALKDYVQSYIYQRWLQELGDRIESTAESVQDALRLERDVKEYVRLAVDLDLADFEVLNSDWTSQELYDTVEKIFAEAYGMLEG